MARQRGLSFQVPPSSAACADDLDGLLASSWPQAAPRSKLDAPPKPVRKPSDCPVFESDVPSFELPEQPTKRTSRTASSSRTTTASPQRQVSGRSDEDKEGGVFFLEGLDDGGSPASDDEFSELKFSGLDDFDLDADADLEAGPVGRGGALGRPRAKTECSMGASPILLTVFEQVAMEFPSRARAVTSAF